MEACCQGPPVRKVAKAVEAGSRQQETVDSGAEPVKITKKADPSRKSRKEERVGGV